MIPPVEPQDVYHRTLVGNVHPPEWTNPTPRGRYNLVVVGAGTAGLVSAAGAAGLGARVALVERHLMGGDCLNYGCVPSKALLRAARAAYDARAAGAYGAQVEGAVRADFPAVMERVRRLRSALSDHDGARRFRDLGVDVFFGSARFVSPGALEVGGARLEFARALLATGARATGLPIPGLPEAGYRTNESIFSLTDLPRRLIVIGAGPIGCEMAQAFRRFGSEVTIVSLDPRLLPREEGDAAALLAAQFEREGIRMRLGARLQRVERRPDGKAVVFEAGGTVAEAVGDEILVAVGRAPNVEGLDLEKAGVAFDRGGVRVDDRLRTANPRIYAAGDVCSVYKFTHAAEAMARAALQNALFFGRKRASALVLPWCTYTDPAVAHVGLYEKAARAKGHEVATFSLPLSEVDRAILDGEAEGFARVLANRRTGRILGATLVARHAGEMIGEVVLAMTEGMRIDALSRSVHPYPTQADVWKRLGDAWVRSRLTPRLKAWLARYFEWRR